MAKVSALLAGRGADGRLARRRRLSRRTICRVTVTGYRAGRVLAHLAVVLAAGCTAPGHPGSPPLATGSTNAAPADGPPGHITVHEVSPQTADPQATGPQDPSLAMPGARAGWNGRLVVFLPGTGDDPSCCQMLLTEAADLGFHVIGLSYDNSTAVALRCGNDLSCYGTVHQNVFTGTDASSASKVPPADGIEHRLITLLSYLQRSYPREGWGRFLSHGLPRYGSIVMAGHSQGGAEAAFIATQRTVAGVVTLSSPPDTDDRLRPASWLADVPSGKTPVARFFAFANRGDPYYDRISADWKAMGLTALGRPASTGSTSPPYGRSHELISAVPVPPVGPAAAHNSTGDDNAQPLCPDGSPENAPAWQYLLQAAAGLALTRSTATCST